VVGTQFCSLTEAKIVPAAPTIDIKTLRKSTIFVCDFARLCVASCVVVSRSRMY
jgi:hypothetical protein